MNVLGLLFIVAVGALGYRFVVKAQKDGIQAAWGSLTALAAVVGGSIWAYWQG